MYIIPLTWLGRAGNHRPSPSPFAFACFRPKRLTPSRFLFVRSRTVGIVAFFYSSLPSNSQASTNLQRYITPHLLRQKDDPSYRTNSYHAWVAAKTVESTTRSIANLSPSALAGTSRRGLRHPHLHPRRPTTSRSPSMVTMTSKGRRPRMARRIGEARWIRQCAARSTYRS